MRAAVQRCLALPTWGRRVRAAWFIARVLSESLVFYVRMLPLLPRIVCAGLTRRQSGAKKAVRYSNESPRQLWVELQTYY